MYPNPVDNEVAFSFPSNVISKEISIFNSFGQEILRKNSDCQLEIISMQSFANGIYFYKIAAANATITGKLIKK